MIGADFSQYMFEALVMQNQEFADRLVRYGFQKPFSDNTLMNDPVDGIVWTNDFVREKVWHGIPLARGAGLNVVRLMTEMGIERKKSKTDSEEKTISKEDAERIIAEMRLKRLKELEDWE